MYVSERVREGESQEKRQTEREREGEKGREGRGVKRNRLTLSKHHLSKFKREPSHLYHVQSIRRRTRIVVL